MKFKNILQLLINYRLSLIKIIFFELLYLVKGNKGNKFTFSKNDMMTDNTPSPYYFLHRIKKIIRNKDFEIFLDLGCGSGRVIDFYNKNLLNKNFVGVEYFDEQVSYCKKNFAQHENIQIIQADFTKFNFLQFKADCYFFANPLKDESIFIEIVKKIINSEHTKRNILLIFVNCNNNILKSIKNIQCIETYFTSDKRGYSIYYVNKK